MYFSTVHSDNGLYHDGCIQFCQSEKISERRK